MKDFSVTSRDNEGDHWDIYVNGSRRYCIRGSYPAFFIRKEYPFEPSVDGFKTKDACMSYICSELME